MERKDPPRAIEVPVSDPASTPDDTELLAPSPNEKDVSRQSTARPAESLQADQLLSNPLASIEHELALSKAPHRQERGRFELPALEDRKTEIAKRDLTPQSASQVANALDSRVPLLDIPKSLVGDVSNQLPSTSVDQPSDVGDRVPSIGLRQSTQSVGGSISRAALDGVAEAGGLSRPSGSTIGRSRTGSIARSAPNPDSVEIGSPPSRVPAPKRTGFDSAPLGESSIIVPTQPESSSDGEARGEPGAEIVASAKDPPKRTQSNTLKSGSESAARGLNLGIDGIQPSVDIRRSSARSIAASSGRKANPLDIELKIESLGLPGPMKLPRLSSAAPTPNAPAVPIPAPAFQQRMTRNDGSADAADLGELGPATEAAIERGLEFLAKHQRPDGSWHLEDFGDQPRLRSDTAATALSLLAFQGAGYSHRQYHYAPVCKSALDFLLAHQQTNGDLYIPMDEVSNANARLYSHSIASLALCEAFGMTQDEALREPAQRAVQFMVETQDPVGGGWRYQPGLESDTSVTGWYMMALKSAELAGLDVPKSTFDKIRGWLEKAQASPREPYLYRYNPFAADTPMTAHGRIPNPTMTSVGLLMRFYLGWRRNTPEMIQGADYLLGQLPSTGTVANPKRDTYYWYYATQVLFHMGGERWKEWNGTLYPLLIDSQVLEGEEFGSWNPASPIPDRWGPFAGRLYVTTLNLLSLEVYYRHLPIYEETGK